MAELKYQIELIKSSGLFDVDWYAAQHLDVAALGLDPVEHYLRLGASIHRDPSPAFSTAFYLRSNPDVAEAGINPLVHYIEHGIREQRGSKPHQLTATDAGMRVDIVIPVYDALDDVKRCLAAVDSCRDGVQIRVIVVDDGSRAQTTAWLRGFCTQKSGFELIEHGLNRGYTRAVNTGLRASTAPYVITLNSDTIVSRGWLKGLLRCMGSSPDIGVVGPLSNAASWQNVPTLLDADGLFAVNDLNDGVTPDEMATLVAMASRRVYPRLPFINGFCFMIRRQVLDAVGYMDEANFPLGYGEENDFCIRVADAGYVLAVADDTYVFHAKSRSFGHEKRKELSRAGSEALRRKHTAEKFGKLVDKVKDTSELDLVRARVANALKNRSEAGIVSDFMSMRVLFLLPVRGGGGGAHSVVQEAMAMRHLGIHARVAVRAEHLDDFARQYADIPDIADVLLGFRLDRLLEAVDGFDVVIATIYSSMRAVQTITEALPHVLPAYYVQDYEPLFFEEGTDNWDIARESYELVPGAVLFAKTHWLINKVQDEHGIHVRKVEPSVDHAVYRPAATVTDDRVHIAAMIRPRTPRRGAERTMRVLARLEELHGEKIAIHVFGCPDNELQGLTTGFRFDNSGVLDRPAVAALLGRACIFIDLSDYQAFGRTALEAMACGCASVVPVHGGADEYAVDGLNALVVDSFDEETCVARLDELIRSPAQLAAMRLAALKTASGYSVHKAAVSEIAMLAPELARRRTLHPAPSRRRLALIPSARKDGSTPTGSAWVRCLLPYTSERIRHEWSVTRGSRNRLPHPGSADVAILQRDATGIGLDDLSRWLMAWRAARGKLVYEIDDDLLDAEGLGRRGFAGDTDLLAESVRWLATNADLITASTSQLAERLRRFNSNIRVVPNRLDRELWHLASPTPHAESRTHQGGDGPIKIGYIGTPSHDSDLSLISDAVARLETEFGSRIQVEIIGAYDKRTPPFGKRVPLPRRNDYPSFVSWLFQRVDWDIALLPLADDAFNSSKSYLKFLEYGALNLSIVCSDVQSYRAVASDRHNALVVPNDQAAWHEALVRLVSDRDLRLRLATNARALVRDRHTIDAGSADYLGVLSTAASAADTLSTSSCAQYSVQPVILEPGDA